MVYTYNMIHRSILCNIYTMLKERIESNHSFTLNRHSETALSSFFSSTLLFYAKNKRSCWKQSRCNSRNDRLHRIRKWHLMREGGGRDRNGSSSSEKIREQLAYKGMPVEGRESARQGGRLSSWLQSKCTRLNCRGGTPLGQPT